MVLIGKPLLHTRALSAIGTSWEAALQVESPDSYLDSHPVFAKLSAQTARRRPSFPLLLFPSLHFVASRPAVLVVASLTKRLPTDKPPVLLDSVVTSSTH